MYETTDPDNNAAGSQKIIQNYRPLNYRDYNSVEPREFRKSGYEY